MGILALITEKAFQKTEIEVQEVKSILWWRGHTCMVVTAAISHGMRIESNHVNILEDIKWYY